MNNLSSYCGLVDAKIRASDKDLPVLTHYKRSEKSPTSLIYYELDFSSKCELKPYLCYAFAWLKGLYHFIVTQKNIHADILGKKGLKVHNWGHRIARNLDSRAVHRGIVLIRGFSTETHEVDQFEFQRTLL